MNILDASFFIISTIIRMGKSTVCNNFQQFYILGHPTILIGTSFASLTRHNNKLSRTVPSRMIINKLITGSHLTAVSGRKLAQLS